MNIPKHVLRFSIPIPKSIELEINQRSIDMPSPTPWLLLLSRSVLYDSFATPWTVAHQAPLSMGFPRHESWSRLPFPPPGDLPHSGIKPVSPALVGRFLTTESPENPTP